MQNETEDLEKLNKEIDKKCFERILFATEDAKMV